MEEASRPPSVAADEERSPKRAKFAPSLTASADDKRVSLSIKDESNNKVMHFMPQASSPLQETFQNYLTSRKGPSARVADHAFCLEGTQQELKPHRTLEQLHILDGDVLVCTQKEAETVTLVFRDEYGVQVSVQVEKEHKFWQASAQFAKRLGLDTKSLQFFRAAEGGESSTKRLRTDKTLTQLSLSDGAQILCVDSNLKLDLVLKDEEDGTTLIAVKKSAKLSTVFDEYANNKGIPLHRLRFRLAAKDGRVIGPQHTVADLGLENLDVIYGIDLSRDYTIIVVHEATSHEQNLTVKKTQTMTAILEQYVKERRKEDASFDSTNLGLFVDGKPVEAWQTPFSLGLKANDKIQCKNTTTTHQASSK